MFEALFHSRDKPCSKYDVPELVELWKEYMVDQGDDPLTPYFDFDASTKGSAESWRAT